MKNIAEQLSPADAPSARQGFLRTSLSNFIIGCGIAWVVYVFWSEFPNLRKNFHVNSWFWFGYTIVAGLGAQLVLVPVFRMILTHVGGVHINYSYAARLMFVAQILRHLPGRLWGIVYLVRETRESIPPAAMIRANLDMMLYSMSFSLLVAGMLSSGVLVGVPVAAAFVVISLILVAISIRYDWVGAVLRKIIRLAPAKSAEYGEALSLNESWPWPSTILMIVHFLVAWLLYLSIWWALPQVFVGLADANIWLLCASYSAAWVVGYVAMITPGGLGIREAGFIAMSAKLTTLPILTFLAVFVRLWQILVEFLLFLMFAVAKRD